MMAHAADFTANTDLACASTGSASSMFVLPFRRVIWVICASRPSPEASETRGTAVIPKSTNENRIRENLQSTGVNLDETDLKEIAELDEHFRYVTGEFFVTKGNSYENIYDDDNYKS